MLPRFAEWETGRKMRGLIQDPTAKGQAKLRRPARDSSPQVLCKPPPPGAVAWGQHLPFPPMSLSVQREGALDGNPVLTHRSFDPLSRADLANKGVHFKNQAGRSRALTLPDKPIGQAGVWAKLEIRTTHPYKL